MAYLDDHPPARTQFRQRYATPSGLIVVHTAESALDAIGEDTGAEGVADFIRRRSDPGSYHRLVDSDSIVPLVRFEMAAYGDGTGSNEFAIHISFACRAADWPGMDPDRREAYLVNGARAAREAATWLEREHGVTVPARRVTLAQSDEGEAGFIPHGDRDPERRTDPGRGFPWDRFLTLYAQEDDMPNYRDWSEADKKALAQDIAAETVETLMAFEVIPRKDIDVRDVLRHGSAKKAAKTPEEK